VRSAILTLSSVSFRPKTPLFHRRGACAALALAGGIAFCSMAGAQTAHFAGAVQTLGSGFNYPGGVAVDASGNVYVSNFNNNSVQEILAVNGSIPASPTIVTLSSSFAAPTNVAVDAKGDVFVTVGDNEVPGPVYEIVAVNGSIPASNPTINALGSGFSAPEGIAVDGSGNVFVADTYNNAVKEIVAVNGVIPASPTIRTLGSGFNQPSGVALDGSGDVFVADSGNNLVKEMVAVNGSIPASPTINTLGGTLDGPSDVALDGSGDLFVIDYGDNTLKEIVAVNGVIPASPTIETLGGGFNQPVAIAVDGSGDIFVADFGNNLVKEVTPSSGGFNAANVGSAATGTIQLAFIFDTAGTLGSTAVVTDGLTGLDFSDASQDTCKENTAYEAGSTCLVNVSFAPTAPGPRHGAAELLDGSGNVLATGLIHGRGVGPQAGFRYTYSSTAPPVVISSTDIPTGANMTIDAGGNVFLTNDEAPFYAQIANGSVVEFPASGSGFGAPVVLGSGLPFPQGIVVDGAGNIYAVFDADANYDPGTGSVTEYPKTANGYGAAVTLASGLNYPNGLAIDGTGNLFLASYSSGLTLDGNPNPSDTGGVVELPWTGTGYGSPVTLASGLNYPDAVALDAAGNLFVAIPVDASGYLGTGSVIELKKNAAGYSSPATLVSGLDGAFALRVDPSGSLFVITYAEQGSDPNATALTEYPATPSGYAEPVTVVAGVDLLDDVALDSSGNIFLLDYNNTNVYEIPRHSAPALTFATTPVGDTSSDSPQTATLENSGNAALSFPVPSSGDNPSIAPGFTLNGSRAGDCPLVTASSSTAGTLAAGADCLLPISFTPSETGSVSGSLVLTDNALNAAAPSYATQTIGLMGNATKGTQTIQFTPPASPVTYGLSPIALTATATSGLAVTFFVTGPATVTRSTLKITGAGSVVITAQQTGNSNYQAAPSMQQTIVVKPAVLTVTAKNASREYGKPNPAFTAAITGFVNGDTAATALTGTPSLTTTATVKSAVGSYPIVATSGTLAARNYSFKFAGGTLTITKAPLTVTANNAKIVYDQALPKFSYTATGFVNGDTKKVLSGAPAETTKAVKGSLPGSYTITIAAGALKATNYSFVFKSGTLTIEPIGPAATPLLKPGTGTYSATQKVAITDATPGAAIYYTVNGTAPTVKSTKYKGPITVSAPETIKAVAAATGYTDSAVATAKYTIK
jgi:sugar lactone lactonase YvrE